MPGVPRVFEVKSVKSVDVEIPSPTISKHLQVSARETNKGTEEYKRVFFIVSY